jgi:hypothetical protein
MDGIWCILEGQDYSKAMVGRHGAVKPNNGPESPE